AAAAHAVFRDEGRPRAADPAHPPGRAGSGGRRGARDRRVRRARAADPRRDAAAARAQRLARHAGRCTGLPGGAGRDRPPGAAGARNAGAAGRTTDRSVAPGLRRALVRSTMPRFAANLSMLYPEHDFLDRFAAAARDGFEAVEYLFPYEHEAKELAARL